MKRTGESDSNSGRFNPQTMSSHKVNKPPYWMTEAPPSLPIDHQTDDPGKVVETSYRKVTPPGKAHVPVPSGATDSATDTNQTAKVPCPLGISLTHCQHGILVKYNSMNIESCQQQPRFFAPKPGSTVLADANMQCRWASCEPLRGQ